MAEEKRRRKEDPKKHYERNYRFQKAHVKQVSLKLNDNTDADVIEFLGNLENQRAFILAAIRKAMEEQKNNPAE